MCGQGIDFAATRVNRAFSPGDIGPSLSGHNGCLPRQDAKHNGWIKDYAVHVSADGKTWGPPMAQGTFKKDDDLHRIKLANPVETRFLKLVALSSFDPAKPYASLAELSVLVGE